MKYKGTLKHFVVYFVGLKDCSTYVAADICTLINSFCCFLLQSSIILCLTVMSNELQVLTVLPAVVFELFWFLQQRNCAAVKPLQPLLLSRASMCGQCQKVLLVSKCCTDLVAVVCMCVYRQHYIYCKTDLWSFCIWLQVQLHSSNNYFFMSSLLD